ncbi:nose resistant to fluoxetine protein 6-like [Bactrocera tryoni]|uniref:nose resistant to fluoxetine protein 6-like n=1 Tax=Bactrocera tryoni TaxID=59916 RepID=UPI001A961FE3|nr:nose resistant to fluoxetine protein 6-like [Bactrocera tryoni]
MAVNVPSSKRSAMQQIFLIFTCCIFVCLPLVVVAQHNNSVYYANVNSTRNPTTPHTYNNNINASDKAFPEDIELTRTSNSSTYRYDEYEDELDMNFRDKDYELYEYLRRTSVIFGLASMANGSNVNTVCSRQMRHIQRGILRKEPWAMKVLDASATKPSGFVFGQNFWLGSREACGAVKNPVAITLSKNYQRIMHYAIITERAPFDVDYRVVYLRHNSPWQVEIKMMSEEIIHVGLCLPSVCASHEIEELTRSYLERGLFIENDIYDIRPQLVYVKDLKLNKSFFEKRTFKMMSVFLAFTSLMLLVAAFLRVKPVVEAKREQNSSKVTQESSVDVAQQLLPTKDSKEPPNSATAPSDCSAHSNLRDYVKCFDVLDNYDKMFTVRENGKREIPVINGLRSVCAMWLAAFHVFWYMYFTVNNKAFLISYAERIFFQYVSSAPLLVDVFFTISGFLQAYNFIRNTKQMETIRANSLLQNVKYFFKLLFHRYLRLGPLYLVMMGTVDLFFAYIADVSVYHISERFDEKCTQYWWRNLIFIQNLFDHNDMCLNWTWSLACEMQYYVLATILLFTYAKNPRLVKGFTAAILVGTIVWSYSIGLDTKFQLSFDSVLATGTDIYISPFVRILPYVLGAVTAWYLLQRQSQIDISELKEKCFWNLAIFIFFTCIYSTIKRDMSVFSAITLFIVGRLLFSLSICWMIVGSATGRGVWWSRILEAKVFQHINRVTYGIYLLNPFVIAFFFSLTNASTNADPLMMCVVTSGFVVIIYLASVVFSLAFEMPYCNWSSLMLKSGRSKSKRL